MRTGGGARLALLLILGAPAACSSEPDAPGAITADEERQLNEAAEMLEANSVSIDALDNTANAAE